MDPMSIIFKKAGIRLGLDTGPTAMVAEKGSVEAEELRLAHPSPPRTANTLPAIHKEL